MTESKKAIEELEQFRFPFVVAEHPGGKRDAKELINATKELIKNADSYIKYLEGLLE